MAAFLATLWDDRDERLSLLLHFFVFLAKKTFARFVAHENLSKILIRSSGCSDGIKQIQFGFKCGNKQNIDGGRIRQYWVEEIQRQAVKQSSRSNTMLPSCGPSGMLSRGFVGAPLTLGSSLFLAPILGAFLGASLGALQCVRSARKWAVTQATHQAMSPFHLSVGGSYGLGYGCSLISLRSFGALGSF